MPAFFAPALQCGRNFRVAESAATRPTVHVSRLLQCGRNFRVAESSAPSSSRGRPPRRFNVAATLGLRKGPALSMNPTIANLLQCGRNFRVAESVAICRIVINVGLLQCGRNFRVAESRLRRRGLPAPLGFNVAATLGLRKAPPALAGFKNWGASMWPQL